MRDEKVFVTGDDDERHSQGGVKMRIVKRSDNVDCIAGVKIGLCPVVMKYDRSTFVAGVDANNEILHAP